MRYELAEAAQDIEIYVINAEYFCSLPWQILKFNGNGEISQVLINQQFGWPQGIDYHGNASHDFRNQQSGIVDGAADRITSNWKALCNLDLTAPYLLSASDCGIENL